MKKKKTKKRKMKQSQLKVTQFLYNIEKAIKHFNLRDWLISLQPYLEKANTDMEVFGFFPPYFMHHSIEYLTVKGRSTGLKKPISNDIFDISNLYNEFYDPYIEYILENEKSLFLFLSDFSNIQPLYQGVAGPHVWARMLKLFVDNTPLPKTEKSLIEKAGLNYKQWIFLTFILESFFISEGTFFISKKHLSSELKRIFNVNPSSISFFINSLSIDPNEIESNYIDSRKGIGKHLELHIPSIFIEKPLIKTAPDEIAIAYKSFIPIASFKQMFALSRQSELIFAKEFGKSFQNYIGLLCSQLLNNKIFSENIIRKIYNGRCCDFLIINDEAQYIIECKGTDYSQRFQTETAIKKSNYVEKIKEAIDQIVDFATAFRSNKFEQIVKYKPDLPLIGIVCTYGGIWHVNSKVFEELIDYDLINYNNMFKYPPQIFDLETFELFIQYLLSENKSMSSLIKDRLSKNYGEVGDWRVFLANKINKSGVSYLPILEKRVKKMFEAELKKLLPQK
jgi:hypothetical protein